MSFVTELIEDLYLVSVFQNFLRVECEKSVKSCGMQRVSQNTSVYVEISSLRRGHMFYPIGIRFMAFSVISEGGLERTR